MELSDREKRVVLAAISLWLADERNNGVIADRHLVDRSCGLPLETMCAIREVVQNAYCLRQELDP
jgi:hypothetical protein